MAASSTTSATTVGSSAVAITSLSTLSRTRANFAILIELRIGGQKVRVELRLRVGGLDDRDPDASCAQLVIERLRIAFDRMLGCGIERPVRHRQETKHRTDVDDAAVSLASHVRHDGTSHADEPKEVGLKNRLCLVDRTLFCSGGRNTEAGVVHEQVDAAFLANEFLHGGFDRFIAGHVEGQHGERPLA